MWDNNKKAAISITYDDGHPSNLDLAIPDLEYFNFRGTFFLTPGMNNVVQRAADWKNACIRGHEIGNHTWSHPCKQLVQYDDPKTFADRETGYTEEWLNRNISPDSLRTYAYTCGITELGVNPGAQDRYLRLMEQTFVAARTGNPGIISPTAVKANRFLIPACAATWNKNDEKPAIEYCQSAIKTGGWAVLIFHHIVERNPSAEIETSRLVHQKILKYLADNQSNFWVAPFRTVYRKIVENA